MDPIDSMFPVTFPDVANLDDSYVRFHRNGAHRHLIRVEARQPRFASNGVAYVDLDPDQVAELHRRLGAWLETRSVSHKWRNE